MEHGPQPEGNVLLVGNIVNMKKKCINCWTYIEQQEWKTEQEKQRCIFCTIVVKSLEGICEYFSNVTNRKLEIRWEWEKKNSVDKST